MAGNVWASGAATAAFDAFDEHAVIQTFDDAPSVVSDLVDQPDQALQPGLDVLADAGVPGVASADDTSLQFDGPVIDDVAAEELPAEADWREGIEEIEEVADLNSDGSGFDVF
jgi:hypothetical protein